MKIGERNLKNPKLFKLQVYKLNKLKSYKCNQYYKYKIK